MKLQRLMPVTLIVCVLAMTCPSQAADGPSVDSILAKYVTAVGGKAAIEKVNSRLMKIKIEGDNMSPSEGEIFAKAPNKQWTHIALSGLGDMNDGFDGTVAWAKSPWEGLRVKSGDELAKVKRDADLHRDLKLKTLYPGLAYKGTQKVGDEEGYVLESKPSPSSKERLIFSSKTGLLVRQESEFEGAQGKVNVAVQVQEHKEHEGLKYPSQFKLKFTTGDQSFEFTMKVMEVKYNIAVEDAKFAKPAA